MVIIMTNITLSIDDEIIKKVKKIAIDKNSTMTAMIREYLQSIANRESPERERKIALLEKSFKNLERDMEKRAWSRDDLYD